MTGIPEPPEYLPADARNVWRAFAEHYAIEIPDIPLFEQFCECYARYRSLMRKVDEVGPLVTVKGDVVTNPNLARADKEAAHYRSALMTMERLRRGRHPHGEADPESEETEADAFKALQSQILAVLTAGSEDASGPAGDCQRDRDCSEEQAVAPRPVRQKKAARSRPPAKEEP